MFEKWWQEDGQFCDLDAGKAPSFDNLRQLAEIAYAVGKRVGLAEGGRYKADDFSCPTEINFINGCRVKLRVDGEGRHYLSVGRW
jgi:hypothetical protein